MRKTLVLLFHPRFEDSKANKALWHALQGIDGVVCRDMYELYPDYQIDIDEEQDLLLSTDLVVWLHPFYWYNCPPLMKQWIDLVLEYGWAYGIGGNRLEGKQCWQLITSGGNVDAYHPSGKNRFTFRELLSSFDQTAHLCHMDYLPPFVVPGASRLSPLQLQKCSASLLEWLDYFRSRRSDVPKADIPEFINALETYPWLKPSFKKP